MTVAAFVGLAEGTIANRAHAAGVPIYDGAVFHRVVPGHVIQAGHAPAECRCGVGFSYPNEIHAGLSHDHAGAIGIPNGGPHTNGSGFYITLGDRSYLDGNYTIFGNVVEGLDVVMSVEQGDLVEQVRILRIGDEAEAYRPDTGSFRALAAAARQRVQALDAARILAEAAWIAERLPALEGEATGVRTEMLERADRDSTAVGPGQVRYHGVALRYVGHIAGRQGGRLQELGFASQSDGRPHRGPAESFAPTAELEGVPAALADALRALEPGERRRVVLPSWLGYGRAAYYGPDTPGEPRFVISPDTMLIYEIERGET